MISTLFQNLITFDNLFELITKIRFLKEMQEMTYNLSACLLSDPVP